VRQTFKTAEIWAIRIEIRESCAMSWGALSEERPGEIPAAIETAKATFVSEAMAAGHLVVDLASPRSVVRERLGLFIEGAIERALEGRGAPPPSASASSDRKGSLADQLERAHVSGATGLAIWFSSLGQIATGTGTLHADDSEVVRWWIDAASRYPLLVGFDSQNLSLGVYLEPETLGSLLAKSLSPESPTCDSAPVSYEPSASDMAGSASEVEACADEEETGQEAPDVHGDETEDDTGGDDEPDPESRLAESARAMAAELTDDSENGWLREALIELSTPPPGYVRTELTVEPARETIVSRHVAPIVLEEEQDEPLPPPPDAPRLDLRFAEPAKAERHDTVDAETVRRLEGCARELEVASGPKPLTVVERLFTTAYVPLRAALDRGAELPALRETTDEWARSFEKSYTESFDALRVRTKRPAMVVDVPDIALRVARLHGARATQLLLVDGMRYDLGNTVNERLAAIVGRRAACAERFLLWAALPTTTSVQVELIGRGPSGLREMCDGMNEDLVVARGRKASMVRRLKTGHREVLKLDAVAARLAEPGGAEPADFDALADEVAGRLAAHFEGLQPRTLVMIFGDHGFAIEREGQRASVREGGGSPEEVLVPAFAWLVGAVH